MLLYEKDYKYAFEKYILTQIISCFCNQYFHAICHKYTILHMRNNIFRKRSKVNLTVSMSSLTCVPDLPRYVPYCLASHVTNLSLPLGWECDQPDPCCLASHVTNLALTTWLVMGPTCPYNLVGNVTNCNLTLTTWPVM